MNRNITQRDIDDKGCRAAALDDAAYGRDFVMWLAKQTALLRAGQFEALDLANLVEELESSERREHRELQERLETLTMHLLVCQVQGSKMPGSSLSALRKQRNRIESMLEDSPSLKDSIAKYADNGYASAAYRAAKETPSDERVFPAKIFYTADQLLDPGFVPGPPHEDEKSVRNAASAVLTPIGRPAT